MKACCIVWPLLLNATDTHTHTQIVHLLQFRHAQKVLSKTRTEIGYIHRMCTCVYNIPSHIVNYPHTQPHDHHSFISCSVLLAPVHFRFILFSCFFLLLLFTIRDSIRGICVCLFKRLPNCVTSIRVLNHFNFE